MNDLLPLLRTVQPGKLNATLSAFATALEGRGDRIGDNLTRVEPTCAASIRTCRPSKRTSHASPTSPRSTATPRPT